MNLHAMKVTDWIEGQRLHEFSQAYRAATGHHPGVITPYMEILEAYDVTVQHKTGEDRHRMVIPVETPENVVALALLVAACDLAGVQAWLDAVEDEQ